MHEISFDAGGVRLFAVEEGSGPPVVMLHGGMADHRAVRPFVASLASRYRVITPDLRGSGKSFLGGTLTFDRLADDLAGLLDHLGEGRAMLVVVYAWCGERIRLISARKATGAERRRYEVGQ